MNLIKVQYDAYNRQFKLLDRDLAHELEDGQTYMLMAGDSIESISAGQTDSPWRETAQVQSKEGDGMNERVFRAVSSSYLGQLE